MAIEYDLKIFISWSGDLSKEIARAVRAWLPTMFDHIDPWASDTDIDAGTRNMDSIALRLRESHFGIVIVTPENMEKTWLNFEAGALSNHLKNDDTRVVPVLVNFKEFYELTTPLRQFQAVMLDQKGMTALCKSIARCIGLLQSNIEPRFKNMWPDLERNIESIVSNYSPPEPKDLSAEELIKQLLVQYGNQNSERRFEGFRRRNLVPVNAMITQSGAALNGELSNIADRNNLSLMFLGVSPDPLGNTPDDVIIVLTVSGKRPHYAQMERISAEFQEILDVPVRWQSTTDGDGQMFYPDGVVHSYNKEIQ